MCLCLWIGTYYSAIWKYSVRQQNKIGAASNFPPGVYQSHTFNNFCHLEIWKLFWCIFAESTGSYKKLLKYNYILLLWHFQADKFLITGLVVVYSKPIQTRAYIRQRQKVALPNWAKRCVLKNYFKTINLCWQMKKKNTWQWSGNWLTIIVRIKSWEKVIVNYWSA